MLKRDNIDDRNSCLNRAADDEPVFVIRAKDPLAAPLVRMWAMIAKEKGFHEAHKVAQAFAWADIAAEWRNARVVDVPILAADTTLIQSSSVKLQ